MNTRDAWEEARRLVIQEGYTYQEAAEATTIPLATLQKRGAAEKWQEQRDATMSYGATVRRAKALSLENLIAALTAPEPNADNVAKLAATWKAMEGAFPEHRYNPQEDPRLKVTIAMEVLEEIGSYLCDTDTNLLTAWQPHIRAIATRLEARYAA